jgi:WD40 repeat protein
MKSLLICRDIQCPASVISPLSGARYLFVGREDGRSRIYDLSQGNFFELPQFEVSVSHAFCNYYSNVIACSSYRGDLSVVKNESSANWNVLTATSSEEVFTVAIGIVEELQMVYHASQGRSLSIWQIDNNRLASINCNELADIPIRTCQAVEPTKGMLVLVDLHNKVYTAHPGHGGKWISTHIDHEIEGSIHEVCTNPSLIALASGTSNSIYLQSYRDASSAKHLIATRGSGIFRLALSTSGTHVAATDFEGHLYLWSLLSGSTPIAIAEHDGLSKVAILTSGRFLIAGSVKNGVRVWEILDQQLVPIEVPGLEQKGVAFLITDYWNRFVVGYECGSAAIVDLNKQVPIVIPFDFGEIVQACFVGFESVAVSNSKGDIHVNRIT